MAPEVEPSGDAVIYRDAWPGVDLRYQVTPSQVKEDLILHRRPGRSSFSFATGGRTFVPDTENRGGLVPVGAGRVRLAPPEVLDRQGDPVEAARPTLVPTGADPAAQVHLSVDPAWLNNLAPEVFPLSLDPSLWIAVRSDRGYKSDGYSCVCWTRVGNSRDNGDKYWRTVAYFPYESLYGKRIVDASVSFWDRAAGTSNGYPFHVFIANAWDYHAVGSYLGSTTAWNDATVRSPELTAQYDAGPRTASRGRSCWWDTRRGASTPTSSSTPTA